jgi:16S rRNA (adenine1518-N6/adenine1519-N6)-dimethyltransferase
VVERILDACRSSAAGAAGVLEVGPGRGALTGGLGALGKPFWAVELDYELAAELGERFPSLCVILDDASRIDLADFARKANLSPWLVAGNLPYNVGTRIVRNLLASPHLVASAVLMLQREVAQKLCAREGEEGYGPLAVSASPWWERRVLFLVPPGAFRPQPKVTSAVCLLRPRGTPGLPLSARCPFETFVVRAFAHPRKTLAGNLANGGMGRDSWGESLRSLGVGPSVRPASVPPDIYPRLFLARGAPVAPGGA